MKKQNKPHKSIKNIVEIRKTIKRRNIVKIEERTKEQKMF
jgi:hypothetical protein